MPEDSIVLEGFGAVDPESAMRDAAVIAARIETANNPLGTLADITNRAQSAEYGSYIATRAAEMIVRKLFDPSGVSVSIVPAHTSRLGAFIHGARMDLARWSPRG